MKIVIVDTTLHRSLIGGAQLFLPGLMKGLLNNNHEVHLVTNGQPDNKVADFIASSGVSLHIKPWKKDGIVEDTAPLFAEWVNKLTPDVYIISVSGDIGWAVLPMLDSNIATLTIGHNDEETFYMPARHYQSFITRVIGVSHQINDHYNKQCNISKEKIDWIPYGVPTRETLSTDSVSTTLNLVYVGRVVEEQKRISDLIAITQTLSEKKIDFRLTIVGDGEAMPAVKEELKVAINSKKVVVRGWLPSPEAVNILRESDIFLLTSAYEGFCIALIEAMANGCCPIVTDIKSGNKELVKDSVNGFVVPVGDISSFVNRIESLADNKSCLGQMRIAAWEEGRKYSIERMILSYEESFHKAATEAKNSLRKKSKNFPLMQSCQSKYPKWMRRIKYLILSAI